MKIRPIFICFFSFFNFLLSFAQEKDSVEIKRWNYEPNFMVGFDVLNAGLSFFGDRKLYQGFISTRLKKNLHLTADLGFDQNIYQKNGYDVEAKGIFGKIGGFYMLAKDYENKFNGFYGGIKAGASFYNQEYFAVPVKGFGETGSTVAFPQSNQSSYWLEGVLGGRVQLFESQFYIDVQSQPRYLVYTTKQDGIFPMIVPGFGKSPTKFNMGFMWSIAYQF